MKNKKTLFAGVLMLLSCLFEIEKVVSIVKEIADRQFDYIADLAIEAIFLGALIGAAVTLIRNKAGAATAFLLALASAVGVYGAICYLGSIWGNSINVALVSANVIGMIELLLFATPYGIMLLSSLKKPVSKPMGFLIAQICAFVVSFGAPVMFFVAYGKNVILDMGLFYSVYWQDILCSITLLGAFLAATLALFPPKRKNRR